LYDSLFVLTDVGQFTVPIIWDSSLINDSDDNTIQLSELNLNNFPNPFNPITTIYFETTNLHENSRIEIFNIKGQKIRTFTMFPNRGLGTREVLWNGTDENNQPVSSGIYFYKLITGDFTETKKCLLLK
jgi:flagellar hook assembly protein FlgD